MVFLLMTPLPALLATPAGLWVLMPSAFLAGLEVVVYNVLQTTAIQRHVLAASAVMAVLITVAALLVPSVWQIRDSPRQDAQPQPAEPSQVDAGGRSAAPGS
ncbi:MAG TPA: hypothetical protein VFV66_02280 [Nonomuraea sp.]|nr:hypothetical protein [Nonomuraea sp.]